MLKVYAVKFNGVWLGGYMVVFAADEIEAREKAVKRLEADNLSSEDLSIGELNPDESHAWLLWNGDY